MSNNAKKVVVVSGINSELGLLKDIINRVADEHDKEKVKTDNLSDYELFVRGF